MWELGPVKGCEGRLPPHHLPKVGDGMAMTYPGESGYFDKAEGGDDFELGPGIEDLEELNDQAVRFRMMSALGQLGLGLLAGEWIQTQYPDGRVTVVFAKPAHTLTWCVLAHIRTVLQCLIVLNARSDDWIGNPVLGPHSDSGAGDVDHESLDVRLMSLVWAADDLSAVRRRLSEADDKSDVITFLKGCFASKVAFDRYARSQINSVEARAEWLNTNVIGL